MNFRIKANLFKNVMGTMFLLAAAFFVCSTLVSMRSVFADPIASADIVVRNVGGRISPRSTSRTSNQTVSRTAVASRGKVVTKSGDTPNSSASRSVGTRKVSSRSITPTRSNSSIARGVTSRSTQNKSGRNDSSRTVRARTAVTPSRVSTSGSVMAGQRAGSTVTYSYLASKLYTGSYSDVIDSSTGLISADAYANCMESYYTCMDEICTARSDTKGRCSCAGRATNFLAAEDALEKANEELIKLSGQLSLLISTKGKGDDLASAFSLTDAEKVMNCVSWKDALSVAGSTKDSKGNTISKNEYLNTWCKEHSLYNYESNACSFQITSNTGPSYCSSTGTGANNFGFDISNIDGSSSDILSQLKAWATAKDLAKEYTLTNNDGLVSNYSTISDVVNALAGITDSEKENADLDTLANKWGYDLFQYAHNNVCGRVLDSCFNGIYEACGTPKSIEEGGKAVRIKCANGATSNCPFNYNSYISVDSDTGEVELSDRSNTTATVASSASCFGYSGTSTTSTTRSGITSSSTDPYATLRGPVADARRSIMQKYLLDSNAACDTYGAALKQTAQNINYQKIAAEQALQQKRLEFKQEEESTRLADAKAAIDNFNECISEIWDCYTDFEDEDWTTARIKSYCSQASQVPHCYEQMICSPLQTQLTAVVDVADVASCSIYKDGEYVYEGAKACRNVVTISEILYGTGASNIADAQSAIENWNGVGALDGLSSGAVREVCLQMALKTDDAECDKTNVNCLRGWKKPTNPSTGD